jgi:hypothetical protein
MTIKSHADKENGMTAALVEMKVETKNPSENKSRVPHCERKKRGSSAWWNGVERLFACLKYTRNFISLSGNHIQNTSRLRHTYGKCTIERNKNWGKKFEAQSTTTFMPIKYFGMIFVVVWLADRCIGNVQNVVR